MKEGDHRLIVDAKGTERRVQPMEQTIFNTKKAIVVDEEAILKHIQEAQRIKREMDVGQKEATVEVKTTYPDLPLYIWMNTDDHMGSTQVDYVSLLRDYNICKDTPNFTAVSNGDEIDNFMASMGKFSDGVYEDAITPEQQAKLMKRLFGKLDDEGKMLAFSFGNHNNWVHGMGYKFENTWLDGMSCPVFNCGGMLTIKYGTQEYKLAMTHRFWGTSKLNPTNACKRFMDYAFPEADVLFLGHVHVAESLVFKRVGGGYKYAVIGGTYKTDDDWSAQMGIGRGQMGGFCLKLSPDKRQIEILTSMEQAKESFEILRDIKNFRSKDDDFRDKSGRPIPYK